MFEQISRTGAAGMARRGKKSPLQVLVDIIDGDPSADVQRLFRQWWNVVSADDDLLQAAGWHAFHNMLASLDRDRRKTKDRKRQSKKAQADFRDRVEGIKDKIRAAVLMDLTLPSGKKLRDATFAECSKAGGWFKVLATKGKPSEIVGEKMSEADLQKIRVRS